MQTARLPPPQTSNCGSKTVQVLIEKIMYKWPSELEPMLFKGQLYSNLGYDQNHFIYN